MVVDLEALSRCVHETEDIPEYGEESLLLLFRDVGAGMVGLYELSCAPGFVDEMQELWDARVLYLACQGLLDRLKQVGLCQPLQ